MEYKKVIPIIAVVIVAVLAFAIVPSLVNNETHDANPTYTINLKKGQNWEWTPTFGSGMSATLTVSASNSAMPADSASYNTTSGNAKIITKNDKPTLRIEIPASYSGSNYYVKLKAVTTQPTQTIFYEITVSILNASVSYDTSTTYARIGTAISSMTPTVTGAAVKSYAISPSLNSDTGLSFSTSTGIISGTATKQCDQKQYTVTVTLNTTPSQRITTTVSVGAYTDIDAGSDYTVYAIKSNTAISVPGVSMPTGTALSGMTISATKDGSAASVTAGTAYNGMTVAASTGAITGTPTVAGTYVFTLTYTATAQTGGSSDSRTITIYVEDQVALSGGSATNSYYGHSDSSTVTKSAGPNVGWSITQITKDGTPITSGTDFSAFSQSNGVITCGVGATAGQYVVTIKATSSSNRSTSSGATGTTSTNNFATKNVTFNVAEAISINDSDSLFFYMATNKVYDPMTLGSNITGATFEITAYGSGITASNINVTTDGVVTPGETSAPAGDYTVTVQAKDPNNATNVTTATLNIHVAGELAFDGDPSAGQLAD